MAAGPSKPALQRDHHDRARTDQRYQTRTISTLALMDPAVNYIDDPTPNHTPHGFE